MKTKTKDFSALLKAARRSEMPDVLRAVATVMLTQPMTGSDDDEREWHLLVQDILKAADNLAPKK